MEGGKLCKRGAFELRVVSQWIDKDGAHRLCRALIILHSEGHHPPKIAADSPSELCVVL